MTERIASGEAEAKAAWDRAAEDLPIDHSRLCGDEGSLDSRDGVGTRIVVLPGFPRLRVEDGAPAPIPASTVKQSHATVEPPKSKVLPFVGAIVGLGGFLVVLITWMAGAA